MERILVSKTTDMVGQKVKIAGWACKVRDHGGLVFVDLRDWSGVVQVVINQENSEAFSTAEKIGMEYVLEIEGVVNERSEDLKNPNLNTGNIEIVAERVEVLNECKPLPFPLDGDGLDINESRRLQYRYIDIRRKRVRDLIENRHKLLNFTRNWFAKNDFIEIQTPLLTVSSPEGARDFLVPSRIYKGKFYALPQAPQQYKQLLMVGGVDSYFQIAPCFRDEDPRADRHSGAFYQLDVECSFVTQQSFFDRVEGYFKDVVESLTKKKVKEFRFPQVPFQEAMEKYGSDKPDLRFDMFLTDLTEEFNNSEMDIFKKAPKVKAILVDKSFSRKEIDELTEDIKREGAKGLAWFSVEEGQLGGSLVKFFNEEIQQSILNKFKDNGYSVVGKQTVLAIADESMKACKLTGLLRSKMGDALELKDPNVMAFAWIVDFPMYEWSEEKNKWEFGHNPFSMPQGGLEALKSKEPGEIYAYQYDLACNGYEFASGAIRNYHPETFIKAFELAGYSEEETRKQFGHMISAFEYGAPPHGGFAPGLDRMMMVLFDESNIREVYAFPKSNAQELMTGCPREVPKADLDILGIELKKQD
jgi:aspartyl-tRNA synthetase